ncbi:hypothetical protein BOX15_Mlig023745g2, partial [Macrostomum lignano]
LNKKITLATMPSATSVDSLFSVELYIDRIRLSPSADCLFPTTLFKLLDFGTQRLSECPQGPAAASLRRAIADYERATGGQRRSQLDELRDSDGNIRIRRGKSALFRMPPDRLAKCLSAVPMYIFLVDAYHQPPKLAAVCSLALDGLAQEVLQHQAKHGVGVPVTRELSGVFGLLSLMGHEVGLMTAKVRLASLGPSVAAHLPAQAPVEAPSSTSKAAAVTEALATAAATQTSEAGRSRGTQYPFPVPEQDAVKDADSDRVWLEDVHDDENNDEEEIVDEMPDAKFGDINDLAAAAAEAAEAEALAASAVFRDAGCGPLQPPPMFYNSRARQIPKKGGLPWTSATKQQTQQKRQQKKQTQSLGQKKQQQQKQQEAKQTKKKKNAAKSVEDVKYEEVVRKLTQKQMQGPPEAALALHTRRQIQQGRMPLLHGILSELLALSGQADTAAAGAEDAAAPAAPAASSQKKKYSSTGGDGGGRESRKPPQSLRFLPRPLPPRHRRRSAGDSVANNRPDDDWSDEDSDERRIRLGRSVSLTSLARQRPNQTPDRRREFAPPEQLFLQRLHDGQSLSTTHPHRHPGLTQQPTVPASRSWIREAPRYRGSPTTRLQFGLTATCVRRLAKHNPAALAELQQQQQQLEGQQKPAATLSTGGDGSRSTKKAPTQNRSAVHRSAPSAVRPQPSTKSPAPVPASQPPQPTQSQQRPQPQAKPRLRLTPKETMATTTGTSATSMTSAASEPEQKQHQPPPPSSVPPLALQRSEDSVATVSGGDESQSAGRRSSPGQQQRQQKEEQEQQKPLSSYRAEGSSDWQLTASASGPSSPKKPPLPANGGSPAHRAGRRLQQPQQPFTPGSNATGAVSEPTQVTPDASFTGRGSLGDVGGHITDSERRLAAQLSSGSLGSYQPSWMDDSLSDHASVSTSIDI